MGGCGHGVVESGNGSEDGGRVDGGGRPDRHRRVGSYRIVAFFGGDGCGDDNLGGRLLYLGKKADMATRLALSAHQDSKEQRRALRREPAVGDAALPFRERW